MFTMEIQAMAEKAYALIKNLWKEGLQEHGQIVPYHQRRLL